MSAVRPLHSLMGINTSHLSRKEIYLLEAELLSHVCNELKQLFQKEYQNYFRLMKFNKKMEEAMLDANYIRFVIKDILLTEEYTLEGIAHYTLTPEEVVYDIATGFNTRPSATFLQRIIDLHRMVKRELYDTIIKKLLATIGKSIKETSQS